MKLLSPKKVRQVSQSEKELEAFRRIKVSRLKFQEEKELSEIRENYNPEKKKIKEDYESFKKEHLEKQSRLLTETQILEERRDKAMEPLYTLKFNALELMDEAQKKSDIQKRELKKIEDEKESIDVKEKELKKREEKLLPKEELLAIKERDIKKRSDKLYTDELDLSNRTKTFTTYCLESESEVQGRMKELERREASVEAKKEIMEKEKNEVAQEWIKIKDQRETLQRAWNELKK